AGSRSRDRPDRLRPSPEWSESFLATRSLLSETEHDARRLASPLRFMPMSLSAITSCQETSRSRRILSNLDKVTHQACMSGLSIPARGSLCCSRARACVAWASRSEGEPMEKATGNRVGRIASFIAGFWFALAPAQAQLGEQPIRIVYPFAAGGSGDALSRLVAERMHAALNRPVIVENRTRASWPPGLQGSKAAPAGGRTLLLTPVR